MLTLPNVRSDGSVDDAATVDVIIRDPNRGTPTGMVVTVTLSSKDEFYGLTRKYRKPERDPATRQVHQVVDGVKVQDALLIGHVVRWAGVVGADGKDLPCTPSVIRALPEWVSDQITTAVRGVPVDLVADEDEDPLPAAEVRDAGFREPA